MIYYAITILNILYFCKIKPITGIYTFFFINKELKIYRNNQYKINLFNDNLLD